MESGVALFDYDNDGRLDIFLVNGAPLSNPTLKGAVPKRPYWNRLYHPKKDGTFEDATSSSQFPGWFITIIRTEQSPKSRRRLAWASPGKGLGIAISDYDRETPMARVRERAARQIRARVGRRMGGSPILRP